ncbi:PGF-pre-PGF domain-containing protein [Candidatus Woesearchaeota archaeon]|nr:PGF-pre-PGF domain-containing protein [Candidatus Woesearchaeota archaeon]
MLTIAFLVVAGLYMSFYSPGMTSITGFVVVNLSATNETWLNESANLTGGSYLKVDRDFDGVLIVNESGIVIDCNHTLIYGNGSGYALVSANHSNVLVKNCRFMKYGAGFLINRSENFTLYNCTVTDSSTGMEAFASDGLDVIYSTFTNNSLGIYLQEDTEANISYNNIFNNTLNVANNQSANITADHVYWGYYLNSTIHSKIKDRHDNNSWGMVDNVPWFYYRYEPNSSCNIFLSSPELIINSTSFNCTHVVWDFPKVYYHDVPVKSLVNYSIIRSPVYLRNSTIGFGNSTLHNSTYILNRGIVGCAYSNFSRLHIYTSYFSAVSPCNVEQFYDLGQEDKTTYVYINGPINISNMSIPFVRNSTRISRGFDMYLSNISLGRDNFTAYLTSFNGSRTINSRLFDEGSASERLSGIWWDYEINETYNITVDNSTIGKVNITTDTPLNITFDLVRPRVINFTPWISDLGVDIRSNITINFSENMDNSTFNHSTIMVWENSGNVSAIVIFLPSSNTGVSDPYLLLKENTTYHVNVTPKLRDLYGNLLLASKYWNFTTGYKDTDEDMTPDYQDNDDDGDGIPDAVDMVKGNGSDINTNFKGTVVKVNGSENLSQAFNQTLEVGIYEESSLAVGFSWDFSGNNSLDLTNISIFRNQLSGKGSTVVHGLPGVRKMIVVDRIGSYDGLCVKDDQDVVTADELSDDCEGSGELFVECTSTYRGTDCSTLGGDFNVSWLCNSGAVQADDVVDPAVTSKSPSGTQTSSSVTLEVSTDENCTCRYDTDNTNYSSMGSTFSDTGGQEHQQQLTGFMNGAYTYYVRCKDSFGNEMDSSSVIAFSVDLDPTPWAEDGAGGGSGGGYKVPSALPPRRTYAYDVVEYNRPVIIGIDDDDIAFSTASIYFNRKMENIKITFQNEITRPDEVTEAPGKKWQYLSIRTTNIEKEDLKDISIGFRVPKAWLEEYSIEKVDLFKFQEQGWRRLETREAGGDLVSRFYEASMDSFSYFAIVGFEGEEPEEPAEKDESEDNVTAAASPEEKEAEEKPIEESPAETPVRIRTDPLTIGILIFILLMIILSVIVYLRGRPEEEEAVAEGEELGAEAEQKAGKTGPAGETGRRSSESATASTSRHKPEVKQGQEAREKTSSELQGKKKQ